MSGRNECVCLLSGGVDSSTMLALAKIHFDRVVALSLDYSQRHRRELEAAANIAKHFQVPHKIVDVSSINELLRGSALTDPSVQVPQGYYTDRNMSDTVVPARNTVFLTIAAGWAISLGFSHVSYAAHAGDHAIYPDCREEYVTSLQRVFDVFHYWPINIWAPFLNLSKGEIVKLGVSLQVPYELTYSCYSGESRPCLKCGTCVERTESFEFAKVKDPALTSEEWREALEFLRAAQGKGRP